MARSWTRFPRSGESPPRRRLRLPVLVGLMLAGQLFAAGPALAQGFMQRYLGVTYTGDVTVVLARPGQPEQQVMQGKGIGRFLDAGRGTAQLVVGQVLGENDGGGEGGFAASGPYDRRGWRSAPGAGGLDYTLTPDGRLSGRGQDRSVDGRISENAFSLEVRVTMANSSGLPAGSVIRIRYALSRQVDRAEPTPQVAGSRSSQSGSGKCARMRMVNRPVPAYGGSITMQLVPECAD